MNRLPGKFVWFEHHSADHTKARAFYEPLFGWHVQTMPMGDTLYPMLMRGEAAIGGLGPAQPGGPARWVSYLSVVDVDASHAAALAAGATSVMAPMDFGTAGRAAAILDPTGAAVSLWRGAQDDPADAPAPVGDFYWNELWTLDADKAVAFYQALVGYGHDAMDMGEIGLYHVLKTGELPRCGVMNTQDPAMPTMWVPYVHVADCDATVAQAEGLGAHTMMPAMDVPEVGRMAVLIDPLGATIAVIKGVPQPG
jgi:predicted enzyme related to lactoylglutathione lyase